MPHTETKERVGRKRRRVLWLFALIMALAMILPGPVPLLANLLTLNAAATGVTSGESNGTTMSPPPPPPPAQTLVPNGAVTYANDTYPAPTPAITMPEPNTTTTDSFIIVTTGYGTFVQNRTVPYTSVNINGAPAESALFTVITPSGILATPGATGVTLTSDGFRVEYPVWMGAPPADLGLMDVYYNFTQISDKVTAVFALYHGNPSQYSLIWLGFTSYSYLEAQSLINPVTPFSEVGASDSWVIPQGRFVTTIGTLDEVGNLYNRVAVTPSSSAPYYVEMNFGDALAEYNDSYGARQLSFAGLSGNLTAVSFLPGQFVIDPQFVDGTSSSPVKYSIQRKIIVDGSTTWMFYVNSGQIYYQSSMMTSNGVAVPGATSTTLSYGFTVVNFGNTVNVLWSEGSPQRYIKMQSGVVSDGSGLPYILWRSTSPETVLDAQNRPYVYSAGSGYCGGYLGSGPCGTSTAVNAPVTAAYATNGQLVFAYSLHLYDQVQGDRGTWYFLDRLDCGDVYCSVQFKQHLDEENVIQASSFSLNQAPPNAGQPQPGIYVAPFRGTAGVAAFFTLNENGVLHEIEVGQWANGSGGNGGFNEPLTLGCFDDLTNSIPNHVLPATFDSTQQIAASPSGAAMELFLSTDGSYGKPYLWAVTLSQGFTSFPQWGLPECKVAEDMLVEDAYTPVVIPRYLTASTEWDGSSVDLFWTDNSNDINAMRIVPQSPGNALTLAGSGALAWATAGYASPATDLSVVASSGHYVFGTFGVVCGPAGYTCVYLFEWPVPTDFNAGPNDPWVQLPGGPAVTDQGVSINPSSGIAAFHLPLVSTPIPGGSEGLSLAYVEPGLYLGSAILTRADPCSQYAFCEYGQFSPGTIFPDLPWFDTANGLLHLNAVTTFDVVWDAPPVWGTTAAYWFNNTRGLPFKFELAIVSGITNYRLYTAMGLTYVFNADGSIFLAYLGSSGRTIGFTYNAGHLTNIFPNVANPYPQIVIAYSGNYITTIRYDVGPGSIAARTMTFAGSSSGVTVSDALGRQTFLAVDPGTGHLTSVTLPTGGKVTLTYATNVQWYDSAGSGAASISTNPVSAMVVYNATSPDQVSRQYQFNYHYQNQGIVETDVKVADATGQWQGETQYRYQSDRAVSSVRTLDDTATALYYDMETLSGGYMGDLSGTGNLGTIYGAPPRTGGTYGQTLSFDGTSNQYVAAGSSSSLNIVGPLTVSAWVKFSPLPSDNGASTIVRKYYVETPSGYILDVGDLQSSFASKVRFYVGGTGGTQVAYSSGTLSANTWYFVAGVLDTANRTMVVYVNGGPSSPVATTVVPTSNTQPLGIGRQLEAFHPASPLAGSVDEVRVFNRALSSDEIRSLYQDNAVQTGVTQDWWNSFAQPRVVDAFNGYGTPILSAPNATSMSYADDWGNLIYTRDAYGNESFASFNNTNHQNEFYAPGRLDLTASAVQYMNFLDYGVNDMTVSTQTGDASPSMDYSTYVGTHPPALKLSMTAASSDIVLTKRFATSAYPTTQFKVLLTDTTSGSFSVSYTLNGANEYKISFGSGIIGVTFGATSYNCGSYSLNTPYTVVLKQASNFFRIFINQVPLTSPCVPSGTGSINGMSIEATYGGTFHAYVDDIGVLNWDDYPDFDGAPVKITNLQLGQVAEMISSDGVVLDSEESLGSATGNTVYLVDRSVAGQEGTYIPRSVLLGGVTIYIFNVDGTIEYVSPRTDFYAGQTYLYVPPRTDMGRLLKTRSGFDYRGAMLMTSTQGGYYRCADENTAPGTQSSTCDWPWYTKYFLPMSSDASPPLSHGFGLTTDYMVEYNWAGASSAYDPNAYLVNYVYIPKTLVGTLVPTAVVFGAALNTVSGQIPQPTYAGASWGGAVVQNQAWANPDSPTYNFFPVKQMSSPVLSNESTMVMKYSVKESDLPWASLNNLNPVGQSLNGYYFQVTAGQAYLDGTSIGAWDTGGVSFNGLPAGEKACLYYANTDTLVSGQGITACTPVSGGPGQRLFAPIYPVVDATPVQLKVRVVGASPDRVYFYSAPLTIWGGDVFTYTGQQGATPSLDTSEWYDTTGSNATFSVGVNHNGLLGQRSAQGDCSDAALCYDMGTIGPAADSLSYDGTAVIGAQMEDLSGHGKVATVPALPVTAPPAVDASSRTHGSFPVGGTLGWYHVPASAPSLVIVSCAVHQTGVLLTGTYGEVPLTPATSLSKQVNGFYTGILYLFNPPSGIREVQVKLSSAGGPAPVECSATTWTGAGSIDTSLFATNSDMSGSLTSITLPVTSPPVPANEVFFSALNRFVWGTSPPPSTVFVAGTPSGTASIVDSDLTNGCQADGSSDFSCIHTARLATSGTALQYSWNYGADVVAVGFGIGPIGGPGVVEAMGASGMGVNFDGATTAVATSYVQPSATQYTISAWVKTTSTAHQVVVQDNGMGLTLELGHEIYNVVYNVGAPTFGVESSSGAIVIYPSITVNDGNFHHLVGVFNAPNGQQIGYSNFALYVDGVQVTTYGDDTFTTNPTSPLAGSGGTTIGRSPAANAWFNGVIDQVAIYTTALSAAQVQGLYLSRLPNAASMFSRPSQNGLLKAVRTLVNGQFRERTYQYDANGQMTASYLPGGAGTLYYHSSVYGSSYLTGSLRSDGFPSYVSTDLYTGDVLGSVGADCHVTRNVYDAADRAVQTAYYDTDSNESLHLDMETATATSFADLSSYRCAAPGYGNSVTVNGNFGSAQVIYGPNGLSGMAQSFDGASSLTVSSLVNAPTTGITLAAWVKPSSPYNPNGAYVVTLGSWPNVGSANLYLDSQGYAHFGLATPTTTIVSNAVVPTTAWTHLVATWDGSTMRLYVNAVQQTDVRTFTSAASGTSVAVGGTTSHYFAGSLDEVRIFKVARSPAEAGALMNATYKVMSMSNATHDDSPYPSSTTYSPDSIPRALYFDMSTTKNVGGSRPYLEDLSGDGNNLQMSGGINSVPGTVGNALQMTPNTWISEPGSHGLSSSGLTVGAWVRIDTAVNWENVIETCYLCNGNSPGSWAMFTDSTAAASFGFSPGGTTQDLVSTAPLSAGWHFWLGTIDGTTGTVSLSIDGGTPVTHTYAPVSLTTSQSITISPEGGQFTLDEVQVIPRVLTSQEASALYNGYGIALQTSYSPTNLPTGNSGTTTDCLGDASADNGDWTNPANAYSSTDGGASATASPGNNKLFCNEWKTFGFNIPISSGLTTVTITDVKVSAVWKTSSTSVTGDLHIGLLTSNGPTSCAVQRDAVESTSFKTSVFDFFACKAWTPADFNGNAIKVDVGAHQTRSGSQTFSLDYVTIQVFYTVTVATNGAFDPTHLSRTYYDGIGRAVRQVTTDLYGHVITEAKTPGWNDRPVYSYLPDGAYTTYFYDFLGGTRLSIGPTVSGVTGVTQVDVYPSSRKAVTMDPLGRVSYTQVDLLDRTTQTGVYNPAAGNYNYTDTTYNAVGWVISTKVYHGTALDAASLRYFDAAGEVILNVAPDGTTRSATYNADGRLSSSTDAMGVVTTYTYLSSGNGAGMGWLASVSQHASGSSTCYGSDFSYNIAGDVVDVENGTWSTCASGGYLNRIDALVLRTLDGAHRLTAETISTSTSLTTSYTYDSAGRIATIAYPMSQGTAGYAHDSLGRPASVSWNATVYATASYDAFGRMSSIAYPQSGSWQTTYTYDAMNRLSQEKLCLSSTCSEILGPYTYDAASQVVEGSDDMGVGTGTKTTTLGYDANGRLISASGPFSTKSLQSGDQQLAWVNYSYDAEGNILQAQDSDWGSCTGRWCGVQTTSYNYGTWGQLNSFSGHFSGSLSYNGDGGLTASPSSGPNVGTYAYDLSQRLVCAEPANVASCGPGGTMTAYQYRYDGTGRRVTETDANNGGTIAQLYYTYTGQNLIFQLNTVGTVSASSYVYLGDVLLFRVDSVGNPKTHYYLEDHLHSVREVWSYASSTFTPEAKYRYQPFGTMATPNLTPAANPRFAYAGQDYASGPDLYHMGARYYAADVGRFTSRDPVPAHGYAYAGDNPVSFRDPSGLAFWMEDFNAAWFNAVGFAPGLGGAASVGAAGPAGMYAGEYDVGVPEPAAGPTALADVEPGETAIVPYVQGETALVSMEDAQAEDLAIQQALGTEPAAGVPTNPEGPAPPSSGDLATAEGGYKFVGTPNGKLIRVPEDWEGRVADNGRGLVFQRPGATGSADMIRIMDPTARYPQGYVVYTNEYGQPLDVFGNPGGRAVTHIPLDYQGPIPGWP